MVENTHSKHECPQEQGRSSMAFSTVRQDNWFASAHLRFFGFEYMCSAVSNSAIPWTVAGHAPLSMGFRRHEYSSELSFRSPGNLPNSGIKPSSFAFPELVKILYPCSTLRVCVCIQSCLTLCGPIDCSPPGSSGVSQVRRLEWVAISIN